MSNPNTPRRIDEYPDPMVSAAARSPHARPFSASYGADGSVVFGHIDGTRSDLEDQLRGHTNMGGPAAFENDLRDK